MPVRESLMDAVWPNKVMEAKLAVHIAKDLLYSLYIKKKKSPVLKKRKYLEKNSG